MKSTSPIESDMNGGISKTNTRQRVVALVLVVLLFALGVALRLYHLDQAYARDGDEGVYWQTLRAMSAGGLLYRDIFCSQPPFFLLSAHFFYAPLGASLWAARFGIAMVSLVGLVGAS